MFKSRISAGKILKLAKAEIFAKEFFEELLTNNAKGFILQSMTNKPVVLPLHHSPNIGLSVKKRCKDKRKPRNIQIFRGYFYCRSIISLITSL